MISKRSLQRTKRTPVQQDDPRLHQFIYEGGRYYLVTDSTRTRSRTSFRVLLVVAFVLALADYLGIAFGVR